MRTIFGVSWVAIIAATLAFYMIGFVIYALVFGDLWLELVGMSQADAIARSEELGAMMYIWGLLITFIQVLGLAWVMNHVGASDIGTSIKVGATIATFIALPVLGYSWLHEGRATGVVGIDFAHLLIAYSTSCAILGYFRGRG